MKQSQKIKHVKPNRKSHRCGRDPVEKNPRARVQSSPTRELSPRPESDVEWTPANSTAENHCKLITAQPSPPSPASSLEIEGSRNETALKFTKTGGRSGIRPWPSPTREPVLQKEMKDWGENEVKGFGDGERMVALESGGKKAVAGRI